MDCGIKILLVITILLPQIATAGLFDILNEQYITDISELPYSSGNPAVVWQESGYIKAWIDVVGFRNLSRENDKYFIQGNPTDLVIVQYDATASPPGTVDSISKTVTRSKSGNTITAHLYVKLCWHYYYSCRCKKDKKGTETCSRCRKDVTESATFTDTEIIPDQFDKVHTPGINIVEYDNTIEQKIAIQVQEPNASKISIRYGNNSVTHTLKTYHVNRTEKGIYYANITPLDTWEVHGQDIGRFGNSVLINTNISEMNYSQIEIIVSDIYGTTRADPAEFNITTVTYEPEKIVFNPLLIVFLGIVGTLFYSSTYLIRRIQL